MRVGHRCDKKLKKLNTKMNAGGDNAHFKIELKLNFRGHPQMMSR
jgi:hypothetical protein